MASWSNLEANTNSTTTTYAHTGLSAGTTRHYRVSAINSVGTGAASSTANATTDDAAPTEPGAPTGLTATASGTSTIDLDWTEPSDDGDASITGYKIEVSPNGSSSSWSDLVANTNNNTTTYSHTGLSAGTTRHYRVSAINSVGTGAASNVDNATTATTVPGAPTSLTATASGTTAINLSWTAPADDGGASITGYRIDVSPNGTSSWTDLVANTGTTTTYSHTGLSAGTTRHYRVSAINSAGTGAASNVDNATTATTVPGAPTSLTATASGTSTIDLTWNAPSDDGGASISGYKIEVSSNGGTSWSNREANTNNTTTTYAHTGLSAGTTRHYRVSAINSVGTGTASSTANATTDDAAPTEPGAPTGLTATASGTSTIDLTWNAPSDDGDASITGYKIEVSPNGSSSSWSDLVANTNSTTTTYSHTGLSAGTTRHYRVSAINSVGTGAASNVDNATTATTVPGAPTSLTATASGTTTINLSWTAPADNGGASITGYRIDVSPNGTSSWTDLVANTGTTTTTYSHTGLSAGTTRHYRVSAINSAGTGAASNVDNATTATTVPGAPTSLTATASGTTTIDLTWNAPSDDGGASISGYKIEVSSNGGTSWSNREANTNSTSTTYAHTGLSAGTTRHYRVSAINSVGTGTASSTANATTDDAAPTEPGAPTGLTATASGTSTIDLDLDRAVRRRRRLHHRLQDRGFAQWQLVELERPRGQHQQHHHHLRPHRPFRRHHPPLPRLGDQLGRHRRRLQRRQRHHRHHRARRPDQPHGNGQRDDHDQPLVDRAGRRRRRLDHRLQDRCFAQWHFELDRPRRQHRHHHHHLLPHRPFRRHHPPLPRLGDQLGRHRRRLQRRQRHHRHHRARRPDQPHGNGQRDQHDRPHLERAVRRRRRLHQRLQDRGLLQRRNQLEQPRGQHQQHQHHLRPHRPFRRHHPPLPRLGHQLGRHRHRLQHRQRHHRRRRPHRARRPDRPHGNGQRDQHDRPRLDRAVRRRRRLHHRLQDRGFAQWQLVELERPRGQHQQHHHHLLPHRPFRRHHPPLPRLGHQLGRHRHRLQHRQRHHRRRRPHRARRPDRPHGNGQRDQHDRPRLDRAVRRRRRLHHRLQDRSPNGSSSSWTDLANTILPHRLSAGTTRHYASRRSTRLQRRQRHHRHHRARRPDQPHGNGQRDDHDQPLVDRAGRHGGASITGYRIDVSPNGTSSWTDLVANTGTTTTTYSHTGLSAGTTRHYRVSAINSVGTGAASNVDNATTATTVPGAPTSLTATASGTTAINLTWNAPSDDGGASISGYKIEVSSNGGTSWSNREGNTNNTTTSYAHTGLSAGTTRHYRVSAINSVGTGTASSTANATTDDAAPTEPGAPTGLTATASGTSTIDLTWNAPSDDGGASITGYKIEVSPNGSSSSWSDLVANTNSTTTTYSHTGLSAGTTRHYRVSAINSVGTGAASSTANATTDAAHRARRPDRPHGNGQRDQHDQPRLDRAGRRRRRLDHRLQDRGFAQWQLVELDRPRRQHRHTTTTYSHTGLSAGTTRHYRVSAINSVGTGTASNVATPPPPPPCPAPRPASRQRPAGPARSTSPGPPSDDGGASITGYRIDVSPNGTSSWTDLVANTGTTTTTYSHTGLSAGTTRHYRVSAINSVGTGAASNVDNATTATTVPGAPTSLTATASGTSTIDLTWTEPSDDGGASISGYKIEVSLQWQLVELERPRGQHQQHHHHLLPHRPFRRHHPPLPRLGHQLGRHRHRLQHRQRHRQRGRHHRARRPDRPHGNGQRDQHDRPRLEREPSDDGGASITGYRIEVSPNGSSSSWSDLVANTNNTTTTYSHTGLSAGTTRHYRVSAINSVGTGTASSTANATTPTEPGAPTGLTATASGTSRINLTWTEPSDDGDASITGYTIEVSPNGSSGWSNLVGNTNNTTTTYSHTGLSTGTTRHYRVSAINSAGTGTASRTANATTGTDTGPLVLTVQAVSATVTEGEPVRYRILMSRPTSGALVESEYSYEGEFVHNGPASVFTGVSSQNGMTYWEIGYETLDDAMVEEDGSFTVRILKPDAYLYNQGEAYTVGTPSSATVTILDNDPEETPTLPIVSVFDVRVDEGPGAVLAFPVRLNVAAVETATIEWETLDGSAKAGQDYKGASGTLVFSPGDTEKTVRVEVIDDTLVEGTEVMLLMLLDAQGAVIDDAVAKGTINDNDAASDAAEDALEDALALVDDLTPGVAAAVLLGEQTLGEAELAALDRLGNRNGRYDLGDLLSWIDRCRRGEARCGRTSTDSGPAAAALLGGAAAGGRSTPKRPGRRDSGRRGRASTGGIRRRARMAGQVLAVLLAATTAWSCTEGSVAPVAPRPDPGFLTVEWSGPATHRDVGVLLELEGPTIDAVRAPGLELYESSSPGPRRIVVAGVLRPGPLVQLRVPDRNQFALYRVRVLQVTGEGYGLRDPTEYRAVVIMN